MLIYSDISCQLTKSLETFITYFCCIFREDEFTSEMSTNVYQIPFDIVITNTLEEFKKLDKQNLLQTYSEKVSLLYFSLSYLACF